MQLAHNSVNCPALKKGLNDLRWVRVRPIAIAWLVIGASSVIPFTRIFDPGVLVAVEVIETPAIPVFHDVAASKNQYFYDFGFASIW